MRIGIDARFYGPEGTGIGRYLENLIKNLELIDQKNDYFVFLRKSNFPLFNPSSSNFQKLTADAHWYSLKEQIIMPAALMNKKLDFVHFPHFNIPLLWQGKFVVTIHDLTLSSHQTSFRKIAPLYAAKKAIYQLTLHQAISRAEKILVPSEYVKKTLIKNLGVRKEKIKVTYEGADDFVPEEKNIEGRSKEIFNKYGLREPYLVFVGNTYPYKNLEKLVEALVLLDPKIRLVCVCNRNRTLETIIEKSKTLGVKDRLFTPGRLLDSELKIILQKASCLVIPSLSEGFGLPGLEAMNMGCPVASSNLTSLPEIYGDAAVYFNPNSAEDIAKAVKNILSKKSLAASLRKKGFEQAKKYSWKKMAAQTLEVYQTLDV